MIAMVSSTSQPSLARGSCNLGALALALLFLLVHTDARAQSRLLSAVTFVGGGAAGLAAHEGGHLLFDVVFSANPGVKKISYAGVPFFAITHDAVSPVREFAISSAGFWVQHATSELILSREPGLRDRHAPFTKGVLTFNVLTSVVYAGAAVASTGPDERDTRGLALSADMHEGWAGVAVLTPALLDAARYFKPQSRTLRWASRAAKVGGALLILKAAGRRPQAPGL